MHLSQLSGLAAPGAEQYLVYFVALQLVNKILHIVCSVTLRPNVGHLCDRVGEPEGLLKTVGFKKMMESL